MIGLNARSTMDLDATVKGINVNAEDVEQIIASIASVPLDDGVSFYIKSIGEIMDEAEYPGIRVSIETKFDGVITPFKFDISTGDIITPKEVHYQLKLMLEDRAIDIWAYNLETILAEKLETIIARNTTNTRMRDFYDIHSLLQLYGENMNYSVFNEALMATANKRGTEHYLKDMLLIVDEVENSNVMVNLWIAYQKKFFYASDISWVTIMKSVRTCMGLIGIEGINKVSL